MEAFYIIIQEQLEEPCLKILSQAFFISVIIVY